MIVNLIISIILIAVLIINYKRIKYLVSSYFLNIRKNYSLKNLRYNINDVVKVDKLKIACKSIRKFLVINSWTKMGLVLFLVLILILKNLKLNSLLAFVLIEVMLIFVVVVLIRFLKKR
ncbi:hypothetical protein BUY49_10640 [Staphylococcus devriesei]|nr:hypothetical protein BUY49_10640 [Staphylococcus devriesei]